MNPSLGQRVFTFALSILELQDSLQVRCREALPTACSMLKIQAPMVSFGLFRPLQESWCCKCTSEGGNRDPGCGGKIEAWSTMEQEK